MKVYHTGMTAKLGRSGIAELGIQAVEAPLQGPCLILWHGSPPELQQVLAANDSPGIWALLISSAGTDFDRTKASTLDPRIHGVPWGLATIHLDAAWRAAHPLWIVNRFEAFIASIRQSREEPPWQLLEPPRVPEHLLACLVAALGNVAEVPSSWERGFCEEVSYLSQELARQNPVHGAASPAWKDRGDAARLRDFLTSAAILRPVKEQHHEPR